MGFSVDVATNIVTVDHSHNDYCKTKVEDNPTAITLRKTLKVTSIFARTKNKRDKSIPGDNCPMLYALKEINCLKTTRRDIILLKDNYSQILGKYLTSSLEWDYFIPLPSSNPLTVAFAQRVQRHAGIGACNNGILSKITAEQALLNVDKLQIRSADKATIKQSIKKFIKKNDGKKEFQIKSIFPKLRKHIEPFEWNFSFNENIPPTSKILLVDDMVTSGTSLLSALDLIKNRYPDSTVEALTLFGSSSV